MRDVPHPAQLSRSRWAFGLELPWLPDVLAVSQQGTVTGQPFTESYGRQIAFLRSIAAAAPFETALQTRYINTADSDGTLRCLILGAAPDAERARELAQLVATTLPFEFASESIDPHHLPSIIRMLDTDRLQPGMFGEVRRSIEPLDPAAASLNVTIDPVVVPWEWSPQALLGALRVLRAQRSLAMLTVHIERRLPSTDMIDFLRTEVAKFDEYRRTAEENPLVVSAVAAYRAWLRELPKACLHLRAVMASEAQLLPGTVDLLGADLSRSWERRGPDSFSGSYAAVMASVPRDIDEGARLIEDLISAPLVDTDLDPCLMELLFSFDPNEASAAFRLPIAPRGGLPGVMTGRGGILGEGRTQRDRRVGGAEISLGASHLGGDFTLTLDDINQHVLVAGLPGFGKTTTVQSMLKSLISHGVPFLVIDPAKGDYDRLRGSLGPRGTDVRIVELHGDDICCNPLVPPVGCSPSEYAGRLLAAFDVAFQLSVTYPAAHLTLGRALYGLYEHMTDTGVAPTLNDLYRAVRLLIARSDYSPITKGELTGALSGRIEFLVAGTLGLALTGDPDSGIDWQRIMTEPTVIQLRRLGGPLERGLMFAVLMAGLVTYRERNPAGPGLGHVTVLEEAHRVLSRDGGEGVRTFTEALAEMRGAGEGFVIVDQAPSLLHPGAMRYTGTKIAHRLVDVDERTQMGGAMTLDQYQVTELARLGRGRAIVYASTSTTPELVEVSVPGEDSAEDSADVDRSLTSRPRSESLWCVDCPCTCLGRHGLAALGVLDEAATADLISARPGFNAVGDRPGAYCLTAHTLGTRFASRPAALRSALAELAIATRRLPGPKTDEAR
jgi:hypothetical protein